MMGPACLVVPISRNLASFEPTDWLALCVCCRFNPSDTRGHHMHDSNTGEASTLAHWTDGLAPTGDSAAITPLRTLRFGSEFGLGASVAGGAS
jgi:hypothetical protein